MFTTGHKMSKGRTKGAVGKAKRTKDLLLKEVLSRIRHGHLTNVPFDKLLSYTVHLLPKESNVKIESEGIQVVIHKVIAPPKGTQGVEREQVIDITNKTLAIEGGIPPPPCPILDDDKE